MITSQELRRKYIEFFKERGHVEIPSASLVPEHDPTVLFTTAGMHPLVPYLLGEKHPAGCRLVNIQKCVRTVDIEDVGDSTHNTFFEMLGNWSLGDYFKRESIRWSWEFLTDKNWLGIDPRLIKVTVFKGDNDAPRDYESIEIWQECFKQFGIDAEIYDETKNNADTGRIFPLSKDDNWWGPAGIIGPCGPDTEIFIDMKRSINVEECSSGEECRPGCKCGRYVEIWNNVFMEYNKTSEGKFEPLKQKNVDTGMGMERTLAILNGYNNVYETDLLKSIIEKIKILVQNDEEKYSYKNNPKAYRIIADHIRSAVFMISDGVVPSNVERGYILRRLIRRAIRYAKIINIKDVHFTSSIAEEIIKLYTNTYLEKKEDLIKENLEKEEYKFIQTLDRGLRELNRLFPIKNDEIEGLRVNDNKDVDKVDVDQIDMEDMEDKEFEKVDAVKAFHIYQTFGFPLEMIQEELARRNLFVDEREFNEELKKHQELSHTATAGKFKGGLADQGEQAIMYHTTTHLLLESLRRVLGPHIYQRGSNITVERLRFDFSHSQKLTKEEVRDVEDMVNDQIQKNLPVTWREMNIEEAKIINAIGIFDMKYGEKVKVYTIGDNISGIFSREICGGPHVDHTGILGKFKIKKEEGSSAGVRRIKAVLEKF